MLLSLGATISAYDNVLFLWHDDNGELFGMLVSREDDFAFCGNTRFQTEVIEELRSIFKIGVYANGPFKYMGLNVIQSNTGILVNQELYIPTMKEIELKKNCGYKKADELNEEEKAELKRLSGQMMWVTSQTRPDLSFETCIMSNAGNHLTVKTIHEANKAVRKLKPKRVDLRFPNLGNPSKLKVISYSDATYASLADGSSQEAFIVLLKGENNFVAPISWQSKKLNRVTKSPLASETPALNEGVDAGILVAALVQECYTDNSSLEETIETITLKMAEQERSDFHIVLPRSIVCFSNKKTLITLLFETAQVLNQLQRLMRAIRR